MSSEDFGMAIFIMVFILSIISITSLIAFKYWGPGGVIEKEQEQHK